MSLAPRRSSSPIRKPSRPNSFHKYIARAATYPCIAHPFPISPNSCFTDDNALEQLLSHSLPTRPSSPYPSRPVSLSPTTSDVTQFPFLLPDPIQPPRITDTMPISGNNSNRPSQSSDPNNNNNNNNSNTTRHPNNNPSTSRPNNRRRRSSLNNNESNSRRRTTAPDESLRCDICLQYYSRRDNLRAHQRVHTGDRPYQCRFCAQRFRWLGALRNHEAIHERDGDHPLNPPPPLARQPTTSSSRQPNPSSYQNPPQSDGNHGASIHSQPNDSTTQTAQPYPSPHHPVRNPSIQRHPHPNVPNLELDLDATHGAPSGNVLVSEGELQSPLYASQENWDNILDDDIPEDRSRD